MPKCVKCKNELSGTESFCQTCGKKVESRTPSANSNVVPFEQCYKESMAALSVIQKKNEKQSRKALRRSALTFVIGYIGMAVWFFHKNGIEKFDISDAIGFAIAAIVIAIIVNSVNSPDKSSSSFYYSIPWSKDTKGHRCIYCGNLGIYRRTPYRTNTTICSCSKCGRFLYQE